MQLQSAKTRSLLGLPFFSLTHRLSPAAVYRRQAHYSLTPLLRYHQVALCAMTQFSLNVALTLVLLLCTYSAQALALANDLSRRADSDKQDKDAKDEEDSWSKTSDETQKDLKTWWNKQNTSIVVLGCIVGAGALALGIWYFMKRRKAKKLERRADEQYGREGYER